MENNNEPKSHVTGLFNSLMTPSHGISNLVLETKPDAEQFEQFPISHDIAAQLLGLEAVCDAVIMTLSNYRDDRYYSISFNGLEVMHHELYIKNKTRDMSETNQDQEMVDLMIADPRSHMGELKLAVNGLVAEAHGEWMNVFENTRLDTMVQHHVKQYMDKQEIVVKADQESVCCSSIDHNIQTKGLHRFVDKLVEAERLQSEEPRVRKSEEFESILEQSCKYLGDQLTFDKEKGEAVFPGRCSVIEALEWHLDDRHTLKGTLVNLSIRYAIEVLSA